MRFRISFKQAFNYIHNNIICMCANYLQMLLTRFIKIYLSRVQCININLISYQKYSWNYAYANVRTPLTGTKNDYKWGEFGRKRGNVFYLKRSKAPKLRRRLITPQGLCFSRRRTWNIFCCYPRADFFVPQYWESGMVFTSAKGKKRCSMSLLTSFFMQ